MSKGKLNPVAAPVPAEPAAPEGYQSAAVQLQFGTARLAARVDVTPAGLLAIGGMVSMMVLASAEIVRAARRR